MKYQEYHEVIRGQLEEQFAQEGKTSKQPPNTARNR